MLARLTSSQIVVKPMKHAPDRRGPRHRVLRKYREPYEVERLMKQAGEEAGLVGTCNDRPSGGACCLDCRRYLEGALLRASATTRQQHRAMVRNQCGWCARDLA